MLRRRSRHERDNLSVRLRLQAALQLVALEDD
jgi:hypothetical protein